MQLLKWPHVNAKKDCTVVWCTCFAEDMFCTDMCRCSDLCENDGDCQKVDYQSDDDAEI